MLRDSINKIRTAPELIERQNWLTGYKWLTVATPHRKSDISQLTMGNYQNYTHTEYTFAIFDDQIRIHDTTIHNDSNGTGGSSRPYIPEHYAPELIPLFDQLIKITRVKNADRAEMNKQYLAQFGLPADHQPTEVIKAALKYNKAIKHLTDEEIDSCVN